MYSELCPASFGKASSPLPSPSSPWHRPQLMATARGTTSGPSRSRKGAASRFAPGSPLISRPVLFCIEVGNARRKATIAHTSSSRFCVGHAGIPVNFIPCLMT